MPDTGTNAPIGTKKAGYAPPSSGPFRCGNCLHFEDGTCDHPDLKEDQEVEHNDDGEAVVEAEGCCNYFRPQSEQRNNTGIGQSLINIGREA